MKQMLDCGVHSVAIQMIDDMDLEYAATLSARAIQSMSQLSVPATPSNYAVWFHYMLGAPPGLRKTIDILLGAKRPFDAPINRDLFDSFVAAQSGTWRGGEASELLNGIINNARYFLADAVSANKAQMATLDAVSAGLGSSDNNPTSVLEILVSELTKANARASVLEQNFTETSAQLERVQFSLAAAEKLSKTDALTGLANRHSLEEFFRASLIGAMESGKALSAFMVDVDYFKKFNDTHGHIVGDQLLRLIAQVLRDNIRECDLAARYGGEEFVVVLPGTELGACKEVAERLRGRISNAKLTRRTTGQAIGSVTVSIGIAQFRAGETAETLIERCDLGLYRAKRTGRNRVVTEFEVEGTVAA